jgi:GNAT superfamily N-acetyltransferase
MVVGDGEPEVVLRVVPLDHPQGRALERRHIAEMVERYGGSGPGRLEAAEFASPRGCFVLATADGAAVGCGGFRYLGPGVAEIKRMYVDTATRRCGLGRRILTFLEEGAAVAGYVETRLETGTGQPEAVSLYLSAGYRPIEPYGEFRHDARSLCFSRIFGS